MIKVEILPDGRTHTYSDIGMKIKQETGIIYDEAVDTIEHTYTETDIPIESGEAEIEDYQEQIARLGVNEEE